MPTFKIKYTLTQVTENQVEIEAKSEKEAIRIVQEHEFEHTTSNETNSKSWEIDDVKAE